MDHHGTIKRLGIQLLTRVIIRMTKVVHYLMAIYHMILGTEPTEQAYQCTCLRTTIMLDLQSIMKATQFRLRLRIILTNSKLFHLYYADDVRNY